MPRIQLQARSRRLVALTVALLAPALAGAQTRPSAPPPLDARTRAEVVDSLAAQIGRLYVDADTARLIGDAVRARLRAGAYDSLTQVARFAEVVTRDLRSVNGDLHLSLRYEPERVRQAPRPTAAGAPGAAHGAAVPGQRAVDPWWLAEARRQNYGLGRVEVLPGNIGYLEITGFMGAPGVEDVVANALRFLERTDAIIIDVRRNGGGSGEMSHLVFSHFLSAEPVPTIRVVNRATGERREQKSLATVPGPRRPDVPLYVLTSQATGSAAEEFSFVLKNLGRATIVGDRTAGAGHMVGGFPVGHGFVGGVSLTRVTDPKSGREWERVGVQPDVAVSPERALDVAQVAAMRKIAARDSSAESRRTLELAAETIEARGRGVRLDAARLAQLAGAYEGDRTVEAIDGKLWYRRRAGVPDEMVPLTGDRFAIGATRFTFEPSGVAQRLTIERPDGTRLSYARVATTSAAR